MISLKEDKEVLLRRLAQERHGGRKGSISAIVEEALNELALRDKKMRAIQHQIALMKKGFDMGLGNRKAYKERSEIYD